MTFLQRCCLLGYCQPGGQVWPCTLQPLFYRANALMRLWLYMSPNNDVLSFFLSAFISLLFNWLLTCDSWMSLRGVPESSEIIILGCSSYISVSLARFWATWGVEANWNWEGEKAIYVLIHEWAIIHSMFSWVSLTCSQLVLGAQEIGSQIKKERNNSNYYCDLLYDRGSTREANLL